MDAFSKEDRIYFATKNKIAYAQKSPFLEKEIISRVIGSKEFYKSISEKQSFTEKLKRMHAAEHKLYRCFMNKIKKLPFDTRVETLLRYIPSIKEIKETNSFSFFCGTTQALFLISFSLSLLLLNNFTNTLISLFISFFTSYSLIYFIQKKYFLTEPDEFEIEIAKAALVKVLEGEKYDTDTHIIY
ncbi:MAG: hypothetical protein HRT47_04940 [Candidatus Caenarcaniphilales bacterium]|nr:hypothetical protein [Candidatus Caenarcaniphilales bacterium]